MFRTEPAPSLVSRIAALPWFLLLAISCVAAIGVASLYSVAGGSFDPWAGRHAIRFAGGLALAIGCALVPTSAWKEAAGPAYIVALGLLAVLPFIGTDGLGARRWLTVAGLSIQPVEIMKVALLLALARLYAAIGESAASRPQWVLLALAMIAAPAVLTVRQPDLGSGLLLAGIGLGIMMLAGVSLWYFAAGFTAVGVALPFLLTHLHGYQRRRIEVFLDPERDPLGAGYHIAQARIALGAGGLHGQGYLQGTQSQLDFLPEKMTDFIFVAIAEEWGFIGGAAVLALYAVIVISLFGMALRSRTLFSRLVISGAAIMLSMYVIINIAMVTGLVPVVGIPLPLVSYGGTSMLTMMVALGIAMSAHAGRN